MATTRTEKGNTFVSVSRKCRKIQNKTVQ